MIKVKVAATSANLGCGFDTLGIALSMYNIFEVELSDSFILEGVKEEFDNENNLFLVAFKDVCKEANKDLKCHVNFRSFIPVARGLGSSSSLIVAGAVSANYFLGNIFDDKKILDICTKIEGHPDNVAPAIFGGLCISAKDNDDVSYYSKKISTDFIFTLIIPDYEVSTNEARRIIPKMISVEDAVYNMSHSLLLLEAFNNKDMDALKTSCKDKIHQPYRKELIKGYDQMEKVVTSKGGVFMISGSGSTCLAISKTIDFSKIIESDIKNIDKDCRIIDCIVDNSGYKVTEE